MSASSAAAKPAVNPWFVAVVVALASFMEVLDTTIANVALRHIAGSLGVSQDESTWVVTTYLVANAIIVTVTGFLARKFGRKAFLLLCLGLFTASSIACGLAPNLDLLLTFRILQGFAGGGMAPVAQSILADSFPAEKRGSAFALFGVAVVVAPCVGPLLGGWLSDNLSWHWCFLINGPVGVVTMALIYVLVDEKRPAATTERFDLVGFLLMAAFLGALELVLDRGQVDDWFGSSFIVWATVAATLAFVLMIPWELARANPLVDLRMLASRQFGACFVVMMATGALLLATTQFLPQIVQDDFGYTATLAGLVLSPGGVMSILATVAIGRLSNRVQPRYVIAAGAALSALSMFLLTSAYADLDFWSFAGNRMLIGVGLPLIFIPITAASYDGLPNDRTDMASALLNAARNTGGSIGISIASNTLAHRQQFHQSRLSELLIPSSAPYQNALNQVTKAFAGLGSSTSVAGSQAIQWINDQVQVQASLLAYVDVFWTLMIIALATIPLALALRKIKLGGPVATGH